MYATDFGKTVAKLRKRAGLTQLALAGKLSVSDRAVSKWETGGAYPEITLLPKLSELLGVTVDYLLKTDVQGIAVAGSLIVDIVNIIDKYPGKKMLANVLDVSQAVGGCVPNTLIDLARLDPSLYLSAIGRIGNDGCGRFLTAELQKHGIDTTGLIVDSSAPTATTNVMTEAVSGERTFFVTAGANANFRVEDVNADALDCRLFHAGYILLLSALDQPDEVYGTKMARLLHKVSERGIKTSIDVVSEDSDRFASIVVPALRQCDYTVMNEVECCRVCGLSPTEADGSVSIPNIKKAMRKFFEYGVREKVIVHCAEGGLLMNADGSFFLSPSLQLPQDYIKGTVGAGDAFAAACLYGLYKGYGDMEILEFASQCAASNLSAADSVSGMRSKAEVEALGKRFPKREWKENI